MIKLVEYNKQKLLKSNLAKELYNKLMNIYSSEDWALDIIDDLYDDDNKYKKMIEIIDNGEKDINELSMLSEEMA